MNAVITGGSKGLGRALVLRFAEMGFNVWTCAREEAALEELQSFFDQQFAAVRLHTRVVDVSDAAQVKAFGQEIVQAGEPIDVLINNAGFYVPGTTETEPEGLLERMMATNLYSAYHLTRVLLPVFLRQQSGHIFNISSIAGTEILPNCMAYTISKHAMTGFSRTLRHELMPTGVKVTTVLPGSDLHGLLVWIGRGTRTADAGRGRGAGDCRLLQCLAANGGGRNFAAAVVGESVEN